MAAVLSSDDPYEYFNDVVSIFTGLGYRVGQRKRGDPPSGRRGRLRLLHHTH